MAQLDKIHDAVKNALIKDSWTITAENFQMRFKELKLYGDLEAHKIFAVKERRKSSLKQKVFWVFRQCPNFKKHSDNTEFTNRFCRS